MPLYLETRFISFKKLVDCDEFFKYHYYCEGGADRGTNKLQRPCRGEFTTYADMAKRLEETEAMSSRAMKKLSENQKKILGQAKILREKLKEFSTDGPSAKDKEIMAAAGKLEEKVRAHADISERLEESEALSTK